MSDFSGTDVDVYYGNGAGGFSAVHEVPLPEATAVAIGDVNGDGIPDLVSSSGYIVFGQPGGGFQPPVSYAIEAAQGTWQVVLADLLNNGLTDIVIDAQQAVSVLLNEGKGKFADGEWTSVPSGAGCGAAADFNGDGKPDLAVSTQAGVAILLGTGKASSPFSTGATITIAGAACLITGDLNGDGIPDLLVAVNGAPNALLAYLGNADGTFTLKSTTATPGSGGYVLLADFNHDGKLDFATSGNVLALGNGDGTFQTPTPIVATLPPGGFSNIAAGDINNDGWPDLILTSGAFPGTNLYVLLNNQHGGFSQVPTSFGSEISQAVLADLNRDGNLDLVIMYIQGGGAEVYLGNGEGGFTQQGSAGDSIELPGRAGR